MDYDGLLTLGVTTEFDAQKLTSEITDAFNKAGTNAGKVASDIVDKLGNVEVDVSWDYNENSLEQVNKAIGINNDALNKTAVALGVIESKQAEYTAKAKTAWAQVQQAIAPLSEQLTEAYKAMEQAEKGSDAYLHAKTKVDELKASINKMISSDPNAALSNKFTKMATSLEAPKRQAQQVIAQYKELDGELKAQIPLIEKKAQEDEKAAAKSEKAAKQAERQAEKEDRLTRSIREKTQEMVKLRMEGKEDTDEYRRLEQELGNVKDAYGDAAQQAKVFADDNKHITGVMSGLQGLTGAFQIGVGAVGLFTEGNEALNKSMAKVQQLMSITMGLQQLANSLNKDSAFRLVTINGLKKIWNSLLNEGIVATIAGTTATKAHTTALEGEAIATTTVSTATKVLRGVLATVGLGAIIAVVGVLIKKFLDWREATKKANEAMTESIALEAQANVASNESKQKIDFYISSLKKKNISMSEEKRLVSDLNSEYGNIFGTYESAKDWLNVLIERENAYCRTLVNRKRIQQLMEQSDAKGEEIARVQATDAKDVEGSKKSVVTGGWSWKGLGNLFIGATAAAGGTQGGNKLMQEQLAKNQAMVDEYNAKNKTLVIEGLQKGKDDIDTQIRALEEQNFNLGLKIKPEVVTPTEEEVEEQLEPLRTDIVGEIKPIEIPAVPKAEEKPMKDMGYTKDLSFEDKLGWANKLERATSKTITSAGKLASVWNNKVGESLENVSELMDETMDNANEMISAINFLANGAIEDIGETSKKTADGTKEAVNAMQSACAVLAIISAALQICSKIAELCVKAHDAKYDRDIERQKKKLDALKESYELLEKQVSKTFGTAQSQSYDQEIENLQKQNEAYQKMIQDEKAKKKTDWDDVKEYEKAIKDNEKAMAEAKISAQDAIFGTDIKNQIESFAEAYVNAWSEGTEAAKSGKDMVTEMIKQAGDEAVKNVIQSSGLLDKLRDKMQNAMKDGIMSDSELKDFYKVGDEITNMLENSSVGWYEDFLKKLKQEQDAQAEAEEEASTEGLHKGIATASQESVDENNARLAGIQLHTAQLVTNSGALLEVTRLIHLDTQALRNDVHNLYDTLDDMRIRGVKTNN